MRESWEIKWKSWFVTTIAVEDQRKPGKLKKEFSMSKGHFVALSPKCYFTLNLEDGSTKKGAKGVPHHCKLEVQNFLDKLYGNLDHTVELRSLRMVNKDMSRTIQSKKAISDLFCKFRVEDDRISCKPLTVNEKYL